MMSLRKSPLSVSDIMMGLTSATVWGLNFVAIKIGLQEIPPFMLGVLRFIAVIFPCIFIFPRPPIPWRWLIALGLTLNAGQFGLLFLGIKLGMPVGLASLLSQAQNFFTLLLAVIFLGERWMKNQLIGLLLAVSGLIIIGLNQGENMTTAGFLLVIAAASNWGAGNVIIRKITRGTQSFSMLSLLVWAGAVAILPLTLLSLIVEGPAAWAAAFSSLTWRTFASVAYLSYVAIFIGYGFWGRLMSRHPAGMVSSFALLVPIVGIVSSSLLLKETLSFWQGLGALLVMAGLAFHIFGAKKQTV